HVLHVGGDHGAAPAIGQRGAHGGAQQRHWVRFHAVVSTVQQLDDFAVDAARRDPQLLPSPALLFGGAQQRYQRAVLQAELRGHARGQVRRHLALRTVGGWYAPFGRQRQQLFRVGDGVSRRGATLGRAAKN